MSTTKRCMWRGFAGDQRCARRPTAGNVICAQCQEVLVGASTGKGPSSNFATKLAMAAAKGAYSAARGLVFSGAIMAMDDGGKSYEADPPSARAKKKAKKKAKKAAVGTRAKKQAKKK